jgi:putative serine protease PepD
MRRAAAALLTLPALAAGCGTKHAPSPPAVLDVASHGEHATAFASGDRRAVTVAHVLHGARTVTVTAPGGRPRRATVLSADARVDLAVLAVPGLHAPTRAAAQAGRRLSARVVVLRQGAPRTLAATVRRPITAHVDGGPGRPALELDAAIEPGDSGAPVLDGDGRVVGVVFATASDRERLAYAVAMTRRSRPASLAW